MNARKASAILLDLLDENLHLQYLWEEHQKEMDNGGYANAAEAAKRHATLQKEYMMPLMVRCAKYGFAYVDLNLIIPPHPVTTAEKRDGLYTMLERMAEEKYNEK